jgi:deoxyribonuclease-4
VRGSPRRSPGAGGWGGGGSAGGRAAPGEGAAPLLLEGMPGAGGQLGRTPLELRRLVETSVASRVGICLDTAHLWGGGYDLRSDGWERVLGEVAEVWGKSAPDLFHANDTPVECGSHRDRHAPPGEGRLGRAFYLRLLADQRCREAPMILEIPPGDDNALVTATLRRMRRWRRDALHRAASGAHRTSRAKQLS